jgi:nucleotidyltransferase substrate binding protein (TIGR01987 family)
MSQPDIRWKQRLNNFSKALEQLEAGVAQGQLRPFSPLEKLGLIQAFEFTHELAWNVLKDYFEYQGNSSITGSRDATREAFQKGATIKNGDEWMEMIKSRNQTTHTYNQNVAEEIVQKILSSYSTLFNQFQQKMLELAVK